MNIDMDIDDEKLNGYRYGYGITRIRSIVIPTYNDFVRILMLLLKRFLRLILW